MDINTTELPSYLLIDIETVPAEKNFSALSNEWQKLVREKLFKESVAIEEESLLYNQRAGIYAEFGKIICISLGVFFQNEAQQCCLKVKNIASDNEADILTDFLHIVEKHFKRFPNAKFVGHNINEFDLPFICRRLLVHQIPIPTYLPSHTTKPWELRSVDTMLWWKFGDYKNYISLHLLAHVLQVPSSKSDIDGSMVRDVYYDNHEIDKIAHYCGKDVTVVANLLLRYHNLPLLKNENIQMV